MEGTPSRARTRMERAAEVTLLIFIASYFYARLLMRLRGRAKP